MRTFRLALSAILLLASAACQRDPASPARIGLLAVDVSRVPGGIRLVNETNHPLAYFAIESDLAARALWGPCIDPGPSCVRLPAHASVVIPHSEVAGYRPGVRSLIVYWWRVVPNGDGGHRVADMTSSVVEL